MSKRSKKRQREEIEQDVDDKYEIDAEALEEILGATSEESDDDLDDGNFL